MKMKEHDFSKVYNAYKNLVMKVAMSVVHDYVLAQDICQDVFVRYCEKGADLDEEFLKAWFAVNTKRKAIDYLRKSYQKHEMVDMFDPDKMERVECSGVDDLIDNVIRKEITCRFLKDLEAHNRDWYQIVVSVMLENRPEKEVARELSMTAVNLRAKLHRAKKWIRDNYKDEYIGL